MIKINVSCLMDEGDDIYNYAAEHQLGVELLLLSQGNPIELDLLNKTREKFQCYDPIAVHGPYMDLDPSASDKDISHLVYKKFLLAYHEAQKINAKHMILHSGFIPKVHTPENWLKKATAFWLKFLKNVSEDFKIYIENVYEEEPDLLLKLVHDIHQENCKICLDVGHVNIHSQLPLDHWIEKMGSDIGYVHLHNNDGITDGHRGILDGIIDMKSVLKQLKKYAPDAIWNLETHRDETLTSLEFLKQEGYL